MMSARAHAYACRMRVAAGTMLLLAAYAALGQSVRAPSSRVAHVDSSVSCTSCVPVVDQLARGRI
jgi:hypothetical protein